MAPYRAILRYYRCDAQYRAIHCHGSQRSQWCDAPALVLRFRQAHRCDTSFATKREIFVVSRDMKSISAGPLRPCVAKLRRLPCHLSSRLHRREWGPSRVSIETEGREWWVGSVVVGSAFWVAPHVCPVVPKRPEYKGFGHSGLKSGRPKNQSASKERRRRRAEKRLSKRVFLESPFLLRPLKVCS